MKANLFYFSPQDHGLYLAGAKGSFTEKRFARQCRGIFFLLLLGVSIIITGCGTKTGVQRAAPRDNYDQFTVSAVTEDDYSKFSQDVLMRYNLVHAFKEDPAEVLTFLHHQAEKDYQRNLLFALAELTYLEGMRTRKTRTAPPRSYFFASVLYAYFYLFGEEGVSPPDPFDRRFRMACDLYNSALGEALADDDSNLYLAPGKVRLPVGQFRYVVDSDNVPMALDRFDKFISTDQLAVLGLSRRNREAGLGAPIIGVEKKKKDAPLYRTFPGTLFMRVNCRLQDLGENTCTGQLEMYSTFDRTEIGVGGKKIPLESDLTAQLAYSIDQPYIQNLGFNEFLHGTGYVKSGIYPMQPYELDKIPLVFVHGTFSSPVTWVEMINTLRADSRIAEKYQIWNFFYDSGKRIGLSGRELGNALTKIVNQLDPEGNNVNLQNMVVIGHSQGGLLTKMIATDSGDAFIVMATGKSLEELNPSEEEMARIEQEAMLKPLPFVSRVVFISTPHRGSFLSKNWVRTLVLKIVSLPKDVIQSTVSLVDTISSLGVAEDETQNYVNLTSLDAMSPESPVSKIMANLPLAKGITGHSIIAIDGNETPPEGDDGVVKYTSAHIDYVESEFLVRSGHSSQGNPLVIEEVRRILLEHLQKLSLWPTK
jgi:pimeloyl-ACP methyl ester carboxylesterase